MEINTEYIVGYCMSTINSKLFNTDFSNNDTVIVEIPFFTYWYVDSSNDIPDNRIIINNDVQRSAYDSFVNTKQTMLDKSLIYHFNHTFKSDFEIVSTELIVVTLNPENKSKLIPTYRITIRKVSSVGGYH